jgi:N-acyl-D-amino-acid deacylase
MRLVLASLTLGLAVATGPAAAADVLLRHATLYDGTGARPRIADVMIHGDRIAAVGPHLAPAQGETVRDVTGLALAPGFIDMHSHHDRGLLQDLDAGSVVRQGVTTVLVGQDGESTYPLRDWFAAFERTPAAINVGSLVGHATVRAQVLGKDLYRPSTPAELARMREVLASELASGAFGLSSGLEYEAAHFATTEEVIALARVAASKGGFYESHVRDEADDVLKSWSELVRIGREAHIPAEITHIKLGSTSHWHQASTRVPGYFEQAKREHVDLRADVYPYPYWYSTIRVLVPDRDFFNPATVARAIEDNGGAAAIRVTRYTPEPAMAGHTLAEIGKSWGVTPVEAYMRIVRATASEVDGGEPQEGVVVSSMSEDDVRWLVAREGIMFCSDGELHGSHPRGAGSFPRILGRYVREQQALTLEAAIHKMTGLPARALGLRYRGRVAPGYVADLVLFDPARVIDRATVEAPQAAPEGIPAVMVSGEWVVDDGHLTGRHPGRVLRRDMHRP